MSFAINPSLSSLLQSSVNSQLLDSISSSSTAASITSDTSSTGAITTTALSGLTPGESGASSFAADLSSLFKDLAAKDVSAAKTDLAQLQKDLGSAGTTSTASAATSNPLQKLFASLSSALTKGDTQSALKDLASFFNESRSSTGNVVNITA